MQLPAFKKLSAVFLETTKDLYDHGGANWHFGTCLWTPVRNAGKARSYQIMLEPQPGDLILHNYKNAPAGRRNQFYLCGLSWVAERARIVIEEPPTAGEWANRGEYYRIDLRDFQYFDKPLEYGEFTKNHAERLRDELLHHRQSFFPFTLVKGLVRGNQGMYLTKVTSPLYAEFSEALTICAAELPAKDIKAAHRTYAEGERQKREVSFFSRHPALSRDAKIHYNYMCQVCSFSPLQLFGQAYANAGIECHHLNPLSERFNFSGTTILADVTVLCANCHRLVHSRRPSLSLEQVRSIFRLKPFTLGQNL